MRRGVTDTVSCYSGPTLGDQSILSGIFISMSEPEPDNRRGAIAGLVIAVVLLAIGIWLARDLTAASKMQDCLMSGRTNCNEIEPAR